MTKHTYGIPCIVCGVTKGEQYEIIIDGKKSSKHKECPKCLYCKETVSPYNGEIIVKQKLSGTYIHNSCPLCNNCGQPERDDDKIDEEWEIGVLVHKSCRTCKLCGKGCDVERWGVEEAHNIPYAHRNCLEKVFCSTHNRFYPCI